MTSGAFEQGGGGGEGGEGGVLPDFTGMDTKFFVQEAAGQVVNQDGAVAGA